jgi:hypothetical protein
MKCKVRSVQSESRRSIAAISAAVVAVSSLEVALGSDHLDTPTVRMNPRGDIGDLYAWTSPDGRQLNLVMTIVGRSLSEQIKYAFHVDSGQTFGSTTATTSIVCRFASANAIDCRVGDADQARGDANSADGLRGRNGRFRVFAGERDDPLLNAAADYSLDIDSTWRQKNIYVVVRRHSHTAQKRTATAGRCEPGDPEAMNGSSSAKYFQNPGSGLETLLCQRALDPTARTHTLQVRSVDICATTRKGRTLIGVLTTPLLTVAKS